MKTHEKFIDFRGNIISHVTGDTFSDQGMLFGTFIMKKNHQFSNSYFESCFCSISLKFSCFFEANLMVMCDYIMVVQAKPMKIMGFFDEIEQKHDSKLELEN